ncbi:hypothetical protein DMN57_14750 [Escherichia coli]|nr:hypothetical protein [Escherichia coli]
MKRIKIKPSISNCVCGKSYWLPQVAVGARDIGGTGLFDAEYLVASKARGRSILHSARAGDIWAPAVT